MSETPTVTVAPYEILVRLNPDGTVRGAIQRKLRSVSIDNEVISAQELPPEPIQSADLPTILDPDLAAFSQSLASKDSQILQLQGQVAQLQAQLNQQPSQP